MELKDVILNYPVVVIVGLVIIGISFAYLIWHLFFMAFLPAKKILGAKISEKSLIYTPQLGYTLADGGEELKKEEKDEEKGIS